MEPLGDTIEYREHDGVRSINAVIQEFGDGGRRGIRKVAGEDDYRASPVLVKGGKCRQNPSQRALPGPGVGDHFMADGLGQAVSTPDQEHGGNARNLECLERPHGQGPPVDLQNRLVHAHTATGAPSQHRPGHSPVVVGHRSTAGHVGSS